MKEGASDDRFSCAPSAGPARVARLCSRGFDRDPPGGRHHRQGSRACAWRRCNARCYRPSCLRRVSRPHLLPIRCAVSIISRMGSGGDCGSGFRAPLRICLSTSSIWALPVSKGMAPMIWQIGWRNNGPRRARHDPYDHFGFGAGLTPTGGIEAVMDWSESSGPPSLHFSCASQHASGPPSVWQCSEHVSQMRQTTGAPRSQRSSTARKVATSRPAVRWGVRR